MAQVQFRFPQQPDGPLAPAPLPQQRPLPIQQTFQAQMPNQRIYQQPVPAPAPANPSGLFLPSNIIGGGAQ